MNQPAHVEPSPARARPQPPAPPAAARPPAHQLRVVPPYETGDEDIDRVVMRCRD